MLEKYNQEKKLVIIGLNTVIGSVALSAVLTHSLDTDSSQLKAVVPAHPGVIEKAPRPHGPISIPNNETVEPAPRP